MANNEGFSPPENKLISVSGLHTAGIGPTDDPQSLYCRDGVKELIDFTTAVFDDKKLGLIDGVPGTGKSSTLWIMSKSQCIMCGIYVYRRKR
jgi:hypothetical protein